MKPPKNFVPDPFAYHEEVELLIDDVTNLGQGVGRIDGWVVFVPFVLPGERVVARIWRNKKQYSDSDLVRIIEASPDRVDPVCGLFGVCGGCQYQHYSYAGQLDWKRKQIEQLILKMTDCKVPVNACLGDTGHTYGYRSKITPHFRRPPHLPDTPIGFQKAASRAIVDVQQCPIASPGINEALPVQRKRLKAEDGLYRRGGTLLLRDCREGVVHDMKAVVSEKIDDLTFRFVAGEFFQNNPHVLPRMVSYALQQAARPGIRFLVDAYCGVGVFGICGHELFEKVEGIEVSEPAIQLARENATLNGVENVTFHLGKAEAIFSELQFEPSETTVLLDPPRKGCDPGFIAQLIAFRPARIVYVSCGPDTQARDLKLFLDSNLYRITDVQPVDLFPQTRHIENIATLELATDLSV
ncbi:class I SAM-dependent RNA methyltransferase [Puniceicoccales bacterium CK1056]|uniref:Class I SAM-dependent RNA methyltransferase n=1 Tax=Oceanipulchritudo coccoides TaxID=2706888 RepID=A0A6B2LYM6_9BACT|nr:class I SAM-dependent RNA methyltransferase [Oceanipulchritudo coccoides]NDV61139.1 class I SAM-dependent RNA methyltransferase [Oceanipulchritudo coccoides]